MAESPPTLSHEALSRDLCWMLSRASYVLTTEIAAALADLGLSPRSHPVLIAAAEAPRTQIELARLVGLDKTTMVVTLDELEREGLAERRPSPTDRRARIVAVTDAGSEKLRRADDIIQRIRQDVLAALPPDERTPFTTALRRLVDGRLSAPVPTPNPIRRRTARR